jgi:hypothetical protein
MGARNDEGNEDWADPAAVTFRPLADDDPGLAGRLVDRFTTRLLTDMSATERAYAREWKPPRFEVGRTPDGSRLLRISFAGGQRVTGWDGSGPDADAIVEEYAESSADDVEWDYWVLDEG